VQALPSLHDVPFATVGFEHAPVAGSQVPTAWHASDAEQTTGLAPVHVPFWQVSACVHALPSLHGEPFAAFGFEHWPVDGLQVPATWHASDAEQVTAFAPTQVPPWQVSSCVQALPSLQGVPSAAVGLEHWPVAGSQVPAAWQASDAEHVTGLAPTHTPAWQESLCVHALPSLHGAPFAAAGFEHWPVDGLQMPAT
jgi:hypothetical protein